MHTETDAGVKVQARMVKESKNMVRYDIIEDADRQAVGNVYVSKQCLPTPFPNQIEIIIK